MAQQQEFIDTRTRTDNPARKVGFGDLPLEIQHMIWTFYLQDNLPHPPLRILRVQNPSGRNIEIEDASTTKTRTERYFNVHSTPGSTFRPPTVLHICGTSRAIALQYYIPFTPETWSSAEPGTGGVGQTFKTYYIDPVNDMISLGPGMLKLFHRFAKDTQISRLRQSIQRICIDRYLWVQQGIDKNVATILAPFSNLREIVIALELDDELFEDDFYLEESTEDENSHLANPSDFLDGPVCLMLSGSGLKDWAENTAANVLKYQFEMIEDEEIKTRLQEQVSIQIRWIENRWLWDLRLRLGAILGVPVIREQVLPTLPALFFMYNSTEWFLDLDREDKLQLVQELEDLSAMSPKPEHTVDNIDMSKRPSYDNDPRWGPYLYWKMARLYE